MAHEATNAADTLSIATTIGTVVAGAVVFLFGWFIKIMVGQSKAEARIAKEISDLKVVQEAHSKDIERLSSDVSNVVRKMEGVALDIADFRAVLIETNANMRVIKDGLDEHRKESREYKKDSHDAQRQIIDKVDGLSNTIARMRVVPRKTDNFG